MGIRGLNKLISQYANKSLSDKHISNFRGCKIAIDSEILIYKFRAGNDSVNSHIHGFIKNIFWYLSYDITPIYIFDGAPSAAKTNNVLVKRVNQKQRVNQRVAELEDKFTEQLNGVVDNGILSPEINETLDQLLNLQRRIQMSVTKDHKKECKYLLKLMGIPFIVAKEDAEALCVSLAYNGKVDYAYTDDSDALTYAAALMSKDDTKNVTIFKKSKTQDMITTIDVKLMLSELGLTAKSFVDMCILSGCDFCTSVPSIGPVKSYNFIKKHEIIETVISEEQFQLDSFQFQDARDIFYMDHSQEIEKSLDIGLLDEESLRTYLRGERNLDPEPIITRFKNSKILKN